MKDFKYINIREVLSRLLRHPLLQEVDLEQVIQYTIDFLGIFGLPKLYKDEEVTLHVEDYRAKLPDDFISIIQVKDKNNLCLRSMTESFIPDNQNDYHTDSTYKVQGSIIFTSFKEGDIVVSYKSIPVDDQGMPLLIDNPIFLKALEAYIKKEVFTILFDVGKITNAVLQNTQQQYAWVAGQLQSEFTIPSIAEMESIRKDWCTLLQRTDRFKNYFKMYS